MEQSWDIPVTAEEIEVVNIMLELGLLILKFDSRLCFSHTWGAKRKRSTASKQEVAATSLPALKLSPSPSPTSLPSTVVASTSETEAPMGKALTSSPATPLSFSPSEYDEKPLPSKKKAYVNSLKKKKEQLLEMMAYFTRRNELLQKNIDNKRQFLYQQKAENLELKQKLSQSISKAEESRLETIKTQLNQISMETENATTSQGPHPHQQQQQRISSRVFQQPLIMDQMVCKSNMNNNSQYPYAPMVSWLPSNTGGLSKVHDKVGPHGLLDLNLSAEEAFGFSSSTSTDLETETRARAAAQARRFRRMQICKSKNFHAAFRARYPLR
ncbi:hypothetical protein DITRI_Ditri03aG0216100 [Diplodiscus trichospermus]